MVGRDAARGDVVGRDSSGRQREEVEGEGEEYDADNRTPTSPKSSSPFLTRRTQSARTLDERSCLLAPSSIPQTPRYGALGRQGTGLASLRRHHSRAGSVNQGLRFSQRLVNALTADSTNNDMRKWNITSKGP
jgi:hypothetical protein